MLRGKYFIDDAIDYPMIDALGAELLIDSNRSVTAILYPSQSPVVGELVVIKVLCFAEPFQNRIDDVVGSSPVQ